MRFRTGLALLSLGALLSVPAHAAAAKADGTKQLRRSEARQVAGEIGEQIVRRNRHLEASSIHSCDRVNHQRVDCVIDANGEAHRHRVNLECVLTVAVRLAGDAPIGKVIFHQCSSSEPPYLSRPRAVQALWKVLLEAHAATSPQDLPPTLMGVKRTNSGEFTGRGVWGSSIQPDSLEACGSELSVRLTDEGELAVAVDEPECKVTIFLSD